MYRVPITVSFDALDTLIQIRHGLGYQYRSSYASFLLDHGVDLDASCPTFTCEAVQAIALKAIHAEVRADRAAWTRSSNPKEMPIGGDTDEELRSFWTRVLRQTYTCPTLYEGAPADVVQRVQELWSTNESEVRRFEDYVLFDQFSSTKAYSWYPEGLRTLQCLRQWNQEQMSRAEGAARSGLAETTPMSNLGLCAPAASAASPVLFLAAPPFVVSNMDPRMRRVFTQLGALEAGDRNEPPLLSRIISPQDVGYAKPSPVGILTGVRDVVDSYRAACRSRGVMSATNIDLRRHVHVGDADADRVACEHAGCHYVQCDPATGVSWGLLQAKLQEMAALCGAMPSALNDKGGLRSA